MLSSKTTVPLPASGIIVRHAGERRYAYHVDQTYRNTKGQPTNKRTQIGRVDDQGRLVPNDAYWRFYPDTPTQPEVVQAGDTSTPIAKVLPAVDSNVSVGTGFLVNQLAEDLGINQMLTNALGASRADQLATVATYMIARGNIMDHLDDFCDEQLLASPPVTGQQASRLFASIDHADRMRFFRPWASAQPASSYYAYDVTSFSTYAHGIIDAEWGYNRDGEQLPQINLGCYINQTTGLPVFYLTYPGSIVDVAHLPSMMAFNTELGIADVSFVMDQGFCSTTNLNYMHNQHLKLIVKTSMRQKTIRNGVDQVHDTIGLQRYRIPERVHAMSLPGHYYGIDATLHIYYDLTLADRMQTDLDRHLDVQDTQLAHLDHIEASQIKRYELFTIDRHADGTFTYRRDLDKIDQTARYYGYFTLLSTTGTDAATTLDIYRRKDLIEKTFDELKNHIDMHRLHTWSTATTDGKLFTAFYALILTAKLQTVLAPLMRERGWSKHTITDQLDKIRLVTTTNGVRLINPLTKTQRDILAAFGYTPDQLDAYITTITTPQPPHTSITQIPATHP